MQKRGKGGMPGVICAREKCLCESKHYVLDRGVQYVQENYLNDMTPVITCRRARSKTVDPMFM